MFKALGFIEEELERPLIGIVAAESEIVPGHIHLGNIAKAAADGVRLVGGVPVRFPAIGVCDGIAMGREGMRYSLVTRELIADSIGCMLMAAARINLSSVFVSGGPMLAGRKTASR